MSAGSQPIIELLAKGDTVQIINGPNRGLTATVRSFFAKNIECAVQATGNKVIVVKSEIRLISKSERTARQEDAPLTKDPRKRPLASSPGPLVSSPSVLTSSATKVGSDEVVKQRRITSPAEISAAESARGNSSLAGNKSTAGGTSQRQQTGAVGASQRPQVTVKSAVGGILGRKQASGKALSVNGEPSSFSMLGDILDKEMKGDVKVAGGTRPRGQTPVDHTKSSLAQGRGAQKGLKSPVLKKLYADSASCFPNAAGTTYQMM